MTNPTSTLRRERFLKLTAVLTILISTAVIILAVDNLLVSFVIAFVINYLISPVVDLLERSRMPRHTAIILPFIGLAALIAFGIYEILPLVSNQAQALETEFPRYQHDFVNLVASTEARFKHFFNVNEFNFSQNLNTWLINKTTELSAALPSIVSHSLTVMMLSPLFAFFMLQDGHRISRSVLNLVPNNLFELALYLQHRINEQLGGFIRARFIEAAIVGGVVWVGLQAIGFPYATLLAIFAGFANLIPYIGPLIGAVPPIIIALISQDTMAFHPMSLSLLIIASIYLLAQLVDVFFVIPMVVAKIVNLHPVSVIVVIIIGAQVMGILGMIISIPVASVLKLTVGAVYDYLMESHA
jgi:putative permease